MKNFNRQFSQRGATLIVSLVLLLAVTVVGIATMKETMTQQKVVNAIADDNVAFQAAEYALRAGEKYLWDTSLDNGYGLGEGDTGFLKDETTHNDENRDDVDNSWWEDFSAGNWANGIEASDYPALTTSQQLPIFVIELLSRGEGNKGSADIGSGAEEGKVMTYRVTARGFGINGNTSVVLQTTYALQN